MLESAPPPGNVDSSSLVLEKKQIPKGMVIHIQGIPFKLCGDVEVEGHPGNFRLLSEKCSFFGV